MNVDAGCLWTGVTQNRLHGAFADTAANQLGRESVTEAVRCDLTLDSDLVAEFRHDMLYRAWTNRFARFSQSIPSAERGQ